MASQIPWPIIFFLAGFFLLLIVILVISVSRYGKFLTQAPAKLGKAMGLTRLQARKGMTQGEFQGGLVQARPFALTYVTLKTVSTDGDGSASANAHPTLRLFLEVQVPAAPEIDIQRRHVENKISSDFEAVFGSKRQGAENLSLTAQQALMQFATQQGPMRLKTRSQYHAKLLPPRVLPDANGVLVHDLMLSHSELKAGQDPEQVWALLDKMVALAQVLEREFQA